MIAIDAPQSMASLPPGPDDAPDYAVELSGVTKAYRGKIALDGVDLCIPRGSLFGLLGPNGAGKSTLINILAGLVMKSAGSVRVWGTDIDADPRQARAAIGVVPQELILDPFFTPRETLELQAGLYGVPKRERRTDAILEAVGLADKAAAPARTLSGGMRRRLMVAKALVHAPPVLVLDEPTAGVDVELRQMLWAHVRELNANGTTVLLTTHYLEEAEELCDRIAILHHGKLVTCEPTRQLLGRIEDKVLTITLAQPLAHLPDALSGMGLERTGPAELVFRYCPSQTRIGDLFAALAVAGLAVADVKTDQTDLQDVFLRLTGHDAGS